MDSAHAPDPSRVHLDIETDDIEAEVRRLEALGATRLQQVHSWKWSQITDGLRPAAAASAILTPAATGRPTAAAAIVQTFKKSRRSTPSAWGEPMGAPNLSSLRPIMASFELTPLD